MTKYLFRASLCIWASILCTTLLVEASAGQRIAELATLA